MGVVGMVAYRQIASRDATGGHGGVGKGEVWKRTSHVETCASTAAWRALVARMM